MRRTLELLCLSMIVGGAGCAGSGESGSTEPAKTDARIAFSAGQHPHEDVYIVNADGSSLRRLTTDPAADFDPSWSPDGSRIAFRSGRTGEDEIYVMNSDGSSQLNLTGNPAEDFAPAWSPDGTKIAFASTRDGALPTIWIMNPDGSNPTQVGTIDGEYPAWSPDGSKIAFRPEHARAVRLGHLGHERRRIRRKAPGGLAP